MKPLSALLLCWGILLSCHIHHNTWEPQPPVQGPPQCSNFSISVISWTHPLSICRVWSCLQQRWLSTIAHTPVCKQAAQCNPPCSALNCCVLSWGGESAWVCILFAVPRDSMDNEWRGLGWKSSVIILCNTLQIITKEAVIDVEFKLKFHESLHSTLFG